MSAAPIACRARLLAAALAFGTLASLGSLGCHGTTAAPRPDAGRPDAGDASDAGPLGDGGAPGDAGTSDGGADAGVSVIVRAIFPGQGPAEGGGSVLITGQGFVEGFASRGGGQVSAQTRVALGFAQATEVDVIDDNRLHLTVPPGTPGAADVSVTNPNGTGTCAGCYRYLARVQVDALEPARGPTRGGTAVTLRGQGFKAGMLLTLGGAEVIGLQVSSATTATFLTPPGAPGGAEVVCATRDGEDQVRSGFVYQEPLAIAAAAPATLSTAGGALTITGRGFTAQAQVSLGQTALATRWIDGRTLAAQAPAHAAGPVDVSVTDPGALPSEDQPAAAPPLATLVRGLIFADPPGSAPGPLALFSLSPRQVPLAGGACPAVCVALTGSGLSLPDLVVAIGGAPMPAASVHVGDDRSATVDVPPGAQAGPVEVKLSSAAQAAQAAIASTDPGALRYHPPLSIALVTPALLPATGAPAVQLTVTGEGFAASPGAPLELRLGALDAAQVVVAPDGRSLTATAPAGSPGAADATVIATDADGTRRAATLPAAVVFQGPLALFLVEPGSGAQSGGATVTLRGRGFAPGLSARFGAHDAAATVVSPSEATCTLPPGNPGAVPVQVTLGAQSDLLAAGFTYFDPQTNAGGSGGGPLLGALNVTVIDGTPFIEGNVKGATVDVLLHDGQPLHQLTDDRGQTTFSNQGLVLPVQVTISKPTYDAITIVGHQTANLTVFLSGPIPPPPPPPPPPDPPPPPPPAPLTAVVSGHVYGFKAPPTLQLTPSQRLVAYLRTSVGSIYAAPPFSPPGTPIVVDREGGGFSFQTTHLSPLTLTAEFGVEENLGQNLTSFTPILLGVLRGVQPDPTRPLTTADLILDTHLDRQTVATCSGLPQPSAGNQLLHEAGVLLDLGNSGFVPLSNVRDAAGPQLTFPRLPQAAGQGFVFVDEIVSGRSVTVYLRRIFGDVLAGITLGPYLPFPNVQAPPDLAPLPAGFDGTFSWSQPPGLAPNLLQLRLNGGDLGWTVVMSGDTRQVKLPAGLLAKLTAGTTFSWTLTASSSPGFDFTYWSYYDLYGGSWTSYAYTSAQFTVPK